MSREQRAAWPRKKALFGAFFVILRIAGMPIRVSLRRRLRMRIAAVCVLVSLGAGVHLPVHGVGVGVGDAVGVGVGVGVGKPDSTKYLPPVFVLPESSLPPQIIISVPLQTAV